MGVHGEGYHKTKEDFGGVADLPEPPLIIFNFYLYYRFIDFIYLLLFYYYW